MSSLASLLKNIPESTIEFNFEEAGSITKVKFSGTFKFQIPNIKTRAKADKERARLNEGLEESIDTSIRDFHSMYAYLKTSIIESPLWWEQSDYGYDLMDANIVTALYIKCNQLESDWLKKIWGEQDNGSVPNNG